MSPRHHVPLPPSPNGLSHECAPVSGTGRAAPREAVPSLPAQLVPPKSPVPLSPWPRTALPLVRELPSLNRGRLRHGQLKPLCS